MSSLSNYLTEAGNAPITYPNLYKPKDVWKIRQDNMVYYGSPDNGYLTASFVLERNLKWPDLGFNLNVQVMNGGRSLIFLTKEDAELFLKKAYENYQLPKLIVAHGRGGTELVRIDNDKIGIPIYTAKDSVQYLSELPDTKVPQYIRDRLKGEVEVSSDQKDKENRERINKEKTENFNNVIIEAVKIIDPDKYLIFNAKVRTPLGIISSINFSKGPARINITPKDLSRYEITLIQFPREIFGDNYSEVEELAHTLVPDKETRDKLSWYNSCRLEDKNKNTIYYPKLSLRRNWDVDRVVKEINNYLDNIINLVTRYNKVEDFI